VGEYVPPEVAALGGKDRLNMAWLAAALAGHINGVSKINAQVAGPLFPPGTNITAITNGVHFDTWVSPEMGAVYDHSLPGWRDDPAILRDVFSVDPVAFDRGRRRAKRELLEYANGMTQLGFDPDILTLGFARRVAPYKRATLIFRDIERLLSFGRGKVQILFAGKAHQNDGEGRKLVRDLVALSLKLRGELRIGFLTNYNMWLGHKLTAGVDVWLNNPVRPLEACGTSGMKAVLNGVPNLSILDGWWAEGCEDGVNGWAVGQDWETRDDERDANALYESLEQRVLPMYYGDKAAWRRMQMAAVATAPEFSAKRMVEQYAMESYGWRQKEHESHHSARADSMILEAIRR
jgi:starch phosphorylase